MIAVDTNILIYAHRRDLPWHHEAVRCMAELRGGTARWALPWPAVHEFFATVTNLRRMKEPTPPADAFSVLRALEADTQCELLGEGPRHLEILEQLVSRGKLAGSQIHDARIAAICISHGISELWSADRDFSRMPALRVRNPLIEG